MGKNVVWALVILTVCIILFIFNKGTVSLDLLFMKIEVLKSLLLFVFMGLGVVVGLLLRK